jgi:hypothetical protein
MRMTNLNNEKETVSAHSASTLLTLLLCADAVFIILHVIYFQTQLISSSLFSLSKDNGYSEFFQYTKFLWVILLLIGVSVKTKTCGYAAWVLLFTYFLADDALQLHENYGRIIAGNLDFVPPLSIRLQDIGELIVTAIAGAILFPLLALSYWRGSQTLRKISLDLVLFLAILIFFGVAVDLAHEAVGVEGILDHLVFRIIEEGGEMVVTSYILWYVFLLSLRDGNIGWFLHERLRSFLNVAKV